MRIRPLLLLNTPQPPSYIKRGAKGGVIFLAFLFLGLSIPDHPNGRVHDEANLLSAEERSALEQKLASFEAETTNQIVIAIFPSLEGESLEDFSIHLAEKWKIGQKGKDNGIILLIFPEDRLLRIEVGYGLEGSVPDAYASRIIEERLKPNFREGNFYAGIDAAIDSLIGATGGVYEPESVREPGDPFSWVVFLLFISFFLVFFAVLVRSIRKYGWSRTFFSGSGRTSSSSGWSSSGGGFSGGGGSFGGGGSSGSW